ncbi:glycosyltransferase family 4 protein [Candidatus Omnitrophota bacterium]
MNSFDNNASIERISNILFTGVDKFKSGSLGLHQFKEDIYYFMSELRKITDTRYQYFKVLLETLRKIYCISFQSGVVSNGLIVYLILRRMILSVLKKIVRTIKHVAINVRLYFVACSFIMRRDRMNVLCLIPKVEVGGAGKVVEDIVRGLRMQNYRFIALGVKGVINGWCRNFTKVFDNIFVLKKEPFGDQALECEYWNTLRSMIRILNVKIILISNALPVYKHLSKIKAEFPDVKIVDLIHAEDFPIICGDELTVVPNIDQRVCIGHELREQVKQKYRRANIDEVYAQRLNVIYNGNDMTKFRRSKADEGKFKARHDIDADAKIITFIGRFSSSKRPLLFVDIAHRLLSHHALAHLKFVMAGAGTMMEQVRARIQSYGMENNFILTGMIDNDQIRELLVDTYALVIVSKMEGLPLVLVEAMAMDVPVITTDVGMVKEAITHEMNGFIVPFQDHVVENMSDILARLVASESTYEAIAQNARPAVEKKFSMEIMATNYVELFDQLRHGDALAEAVI